MGVSAVGPVTVAHAVKMEINGYSVTSVSLLDEKERAQSDQTFYKLAYDRQEGDEGGLGSVPANPPIVLSSTKPSQAAWPHPKDCRELWPKRNRLDAMRLSRLAAQNPAQYGAPNLGPGCAGG